MLLLRLSAVTVFSLAIRSLVAAANLTHVVKNRSVSVTIATPSATARV